MRVSAYVGTTKSAKTNDERVDKNIAQSVT